MKGVRAVAFSSPHKAANVAALADGMALFEDMARHHIDGITQFGEAMTRPFNSFDTATMHLGMHGYNLFEAGIDLVLQGRFDVASYLYRSLRDCPDLVLLVGDDPELAERLLNDEIEVKVGDEKKAAVGRLRATDAAAAAQWDRLFKSENAEYQRLSHVGPGHFGMVLTLPDANGDRFPVLGGMDAGEGSRAFARVFVMNEATLLLVLGMSWQDKLSANWADRTKVLVARAAEWLS